MQDQPALDETQKRVRREVWTWALALSLLAAALLAWAVASRANLHLRERDRLSGQARAVELNLARSLEGAYAALRFLRDEAQRWPAGQLANALGLQMQALRNAMPGVQTLQWIDANGQVLASSQAELVGQGMAQPAVLGNLRKPSDPSLLVVSKPQPGGDEARALVLALAIAPAPTGFAGAMVATLDTAFFGTALGSVRYADDMQAEVALAGGAVLAASPPVPAGRSLSQPGTPFTQHRDSGLQQSVQVGQLPGRAEIRLVAQRSFKPANVPMDVSLVLFVSRALDDIEEPWQRQVGIAALAFVALLGGSWLALRLLQRRRSEMDLPWPPSVRPSRPRMPSNWRWLCAAPTWHCGMPSRPEVARRSTTAGSPSSACSLARSRPTTKPGSRACTPKTSRQ
jgi:hypothetical protein